MDSDSHKEEEKMNVQFLHSDCALQCARCIPTSPGRLTKPPFILSLLQYFDIFILPLLQYSDTTTVFPSRAADGILLVFSLDDPKSFDEVTFQYLIFSLNVA